MAKSEKRISVNAFERVMKESFVPAETVLWHDTEIVVKRSLSLKETLEFAKTVAESCFDDNGEFLPEVSDFIIRSNILEMYANFRLPDDLEKRYELLYGTDAVETVVEHINGQQLQELVNAINRKVEYMCSIRTDELRAQLRRLLDAFEMMQKTTEEIFDNVSPDDLKKLIGAVDEHGKIDEAKIVDALMERKDAEKDTDVK